MTANLISSGSDTDVRIGVVVGLSLAIAVSLATIVGHVGTAEERGRVVLSASTPEIVRTAPEIVRAAKLVAQHVDETGAALE